jgi:hypothetical protein
MHSDPAAQDYYRKRRNRVRGIGQHVSELRRLVSEYESSEEKKKAQKCLDDFMLWLARAR